MNQISDLGGVIQNEYRKSGNFHVIIIKIFMLKIFRRTTQPMKIILHRNFISNTFTCKDHEKTYDLVSICRDQP